jgi:hypothetical protein
MQAPKLVDVKNVPTEELQHVDSDKVHALAKPPRPYAASRA